MFFRRKYCPFCGDEIKNNKVCRYCCNILKQLINKKVKKTKDCCYLTAPFIYKDIVREAILDFKFEKKKEFCKNFCYFMLGCKIDSFDIMVCVPTYEKKFNSSKELAKVLSKKLKIKFYKDAVIKTKKTKNQHNCAIKERLINLKGAFKANQKLVDGKRVLICDDIITTASTIQEISNALKKAGASYVGAIAFAISDIF